MLKILNSFAGIGGNRKLWKNVEVVAVENNKKIATILRIQWRFLRKSLRG